jgi:hypothetical protein
MEQGFKPQMAETLLRRGFGGQVDADFNRYKWPQPNSGEEKALPA